MDPKDDPRLAGETLAEPAHVRLAGVFCIAGGALFMAFYKGMWLRGLIPMSWVGAGLVAAGVWCLIDAQNPWLLRRVGRVVAVVRDQTPG